MEISNDLISALQNLRVTSSSTPATADLALKLGEQILAKVLSVQEQGLATLLINNSQVQARTQIPLKTGQLLNLLVTASGDEIVLKPTEQDMRRALIEQNLRETLPKEQSLDHVLTKITQTLRDPALQKQLPKHVTEAIRQTIEKFPTSRDAQSPDGLKQIIKNSGTFTERNLAQALTQPTQTRTANVAQTVQSDLKLMLEQLKQQLQSVKTELANQLPDPVKSPLPIPNNNTPTSSTNSVAKSQAEPDNTTELPLSSTTKAANTNPKSVEAIPAKTDARAPNLSSEPVPKQTPGNNDSIAKPIPTTVSPHIGTPVAAKPDNRALPLPPVLSESSDTDTSSHDTSTPYVGDESKRVSSKQINTIQLQRETAVALTQRGQNNIREIIDALENLVKSVDSAISRTQLHQLHNVQETDQGRFAWIFEIPLRNGEKLDLLKMRIERDGRGNKTQNADMPITVTLAVDLEHIGPVQAKVVLVKSSVNVSFWAERQPTYQMMRDELDELKSRLQKSGLKTERIVAHHGQPPNVFNVPLPSSGLLDLSA